MLQVTNYGICGECKYHKCEKPGAWVCVCKDSDYYTDYTEYTDGCREWTQKGIDK